MGLFKRGKKHAITSQQSPTPTQAPAPAIAGIADEVVASGDFEVVVRSLIAQFAPAGTELVETDDDSIVVGEGTVYLGNYRKGWNQQAAGEREVWLRNALHGAFLSELRDTSTLDLTMLRPGIRSEWYLNAPVLAASAERGGSILTHDIAVRPLGPGLVRVLLWDTPTTMSIISNDQISKWGSDFETLWDVAVQNLANDPSDDRWGQANDCCWMPVQSDDYTAERLFIDGFLDKTGLAGDVVIFHPNRATLIVVDPNDAAGIELGAKIALGGVSDPNPITMLPYIGRGLSWRPLELAADHPAQAAVTELRLKELAPTYAQQKELLADIHGDDLFVATCMVYQTDAGMITIASWTEGTVSLLPKTDLINFTFGLNDPEPQSVMVTWDIAKAIVGNRLEATAHWPERWRVSSFPTTDEIARLREHA